MNKSSKLIGIILIGLIGLSVAIIVSMSTDQQVKKIQTNEPGYASYVKSEKVNKLDSRKPFTEKELSDIREFTSKINFKPKEPVCMYHRHGEVKGMY